MAVACNGTTVAAAGDTKFYIDILIDFTQYYWTIVM